MERRKSGGSRVDRYVEACRELGLPPLAHPLSVRLVGGRETYLATASAADELANQHRIRRELVQGPEVLECRGDRIVHAVCRATLPDERTATGASTLSFHSIEAFMQCETRARRLATLRVLGLERYADSERETIPSGYTLVPNTELRAESMELPSSKLTSEPFRTIEMKSLASTTHPFTTEPYTSEAMPSEPMREISLRTLVEPSRATVYVPGGPPLTTSDTLTSFLREVSLLAREEQASPLWIERRTALAVLPAEERTAAWEALCARVASLGRGRTAKEWLKQQITAQLPP